MTATYLSSGSPASSLRQGAAGAVAPTPPAFWKALAFPQRYCHAEWHDNLRAWPAAERLTLRSLEAPLSLATLFSRDRRDFRAMLMVAGLAWYAPAIRKVISGRERTQLNEMLGREVIATLLEPGLACSVPGQAGASDIAALLRGGTDAAAEAGIALLAGCTECHGAGWSHCLKIRVSRAAGTVIDHTAALSPDACAERLNWFSSQLPALIEQQCIGHLVARQIDESSAD